MSKIKEDKDDDFQRIPDLQESQIHEGESTKSDEGHPQLKIFKEDSRDASLKAIFYSELGLKNHNRYGEIEYKN